MGFFLLNVKFIYQSGACIETFNTTQFRVISRHNPLLKVSHNYHKCNANTTERHPVPVKGYYSLGSHHSNTLVFPPPQGRRLIVIAFKPCPRCFWTLSPTYIAIHAPLSTAVAHIPGLVKSQMAQVPVSHTHPTVCSLQRSVGRRTFHTCWVLAGPYRCYRSPFLFWIYHMHCVWL